MKKGINIFLVIILGIGCVIPNVFGSDPDPCEKALEKGEIPPLLLISSGRDQDVFPQYQKDFPIITRAAQHVGISVFPHRVELVPSGQLTVLSATNSYAQPTWPDGARIVHSAHHAMGVLEFVHQGCPTCRSFYQDTTSLEHQRSIFIHVIGHNDFGGHTAFSLIRPNIDAMAHSLRLQELIRRLYDEKDHDAVSLWYQLLLSIDHLQDYTLGTFDHPDTFDPAKKEDPGIVYAHETDMFGFPLENTNIYSTPQHPKRPTRSILQFLSRNLPDTVPSWKKEMLDLFERWNRFGPSYVQTKIINEGWATFMMYFLVPYTPWRESKDLVKYANLLWGVAWPRISNPYWLGLECWQNLYRRFKERPDIQTLSPLERDRAFVKYAHEIIKADSDYDFILRALDERWIVEQGFYLDREAQMNEWDYSIWPDKKPEDETQRIVISRDPKRIIHWIARRAADRALQIPQISLVNSNGLGRGVFTLKHEVYDDIPLKFKSSVQTLWVISRIVEKPMSLETVASTSWLPLPMIPSEPFLVRYFGHLDWWKLKPPKPHISPIRIEVSPDGKVQVFYQKEPEKISNAQKLPELPEKLHIKLTEKAKAILDVFKLDVEGSVNSDLSARESEKFMGIVSKILDHATDPLLGLLHHGPGTAEALLEYDRMIKMRLAGILKDIFQGKNKDKIKRVGKAVRIKVLPTIPEFELDLRVKRLLKDSLPPQPVDPLSLKTFQAKDDNSGVGKDKKKNPGDRYWGKGGSGEPGEDGRPGEDRDGDSDDGDDPTGEPGDEPGDGSNDPSYIDIPVEVWAKYLKEELELPNTRKLDAKSDEKEPYRMGSRKHPVGPVIWEKTIPEALIHSMAERVREGKPLLEDIPQQLIEGAKFITPQDYVVPGADEEPQPNIEAVMVFLADMSGSMLGKPQQIETSLVENLKLLLQEKYKRIIFRFIGFDTQAREFTEEEMLTQTLGGGTLYSSGYQLAEEILDTYSDGKYDKFLVGMGDCQTGDVQETMALIQRLYEHTRYMTFAHVDAYYPFPDIDLARAAKEFSATHEWFGFGYLNQEEDVLRVLRELFGKDRKKK